MPEQPDLEAIAATTEDYFQGMYRRDIGRLRRAFHPSAFLFGHLDGRFVHVSLDEWLAKVEGSPVPADIGEPYDMRIVSIDVTHDVATVKVADLYRGRRFTDYLTMLKLEGKWAVVNKAFRHD